jgi:hypothetical protein
MTMLWMGARSYRSPVMTGFWEASTAPIARVYRGDIWFEWRDVLGVPMLDDRINSQDNQVVSPEPPTEFMARVRALGSSWLVQPNGRMQVDAGVDYPIISNRVQTLVDRTRKFQSCRAVLLHGPPGGGKSVAARQVLKALSQAPVTLDPRAAGDARVWEAVHEIRPDGILVDDLDSIGQLDDLLSELVRARAYARVIVTTANVIEPLRGALKRCGRASDDDPVHFGALDEVTARAIAPLAAQQGVGSGLLAAYLAELEARLEAGVVTNIDEDVQELTRRMSEAGDK